MRRSAKAVGVLALAVWMAAFSCNAQQWFQLVGALLPIIGQTYLQFYGFSQKGGVGADDIAKVQRLTSSGQDILSRVGGLVNEFEKTKSASTVVQIDGLITELQADVDGFLADTGIRNSANFAKYKLFADAILTDVKDLAGLIPIISGPPAHAEGAVTYTMRSSLPQAKSLEDVFKARLNSLPK
jgi:hypothetical protein